MATASPPDFFDDLDRFLGSLCTSLRDVVDDDLLSRRAHFLGNGLAQSTRRSRHKNNLGVVRDHVQTSSSTAASTAFFG